MENGGWDNGRSLDEIASYIAYALQLIKNLDLPCEGFTTPGGFGNGGKSVLSQAAMYANSEGAPGVALFRWAFDRSFGHGLGESSTDLRHDLGAAQVVVARVGASFHDLTVFGREH
jgi:hypothetical protein